MIVSFYSYKGGVGRTQLCANVAAYLCHQKGKRVLLWDWDWEAPGLHYFFGKTNEDINKKGTLELFEDYVIYMRKNANVRQVKDPNKDINSSEENKGVMPDELTFISEKNITNLAYGPEKSSCIDLLPAGNYSANFSGRANNFDWYDFYSMKDGVNYIELLKDNLKNLNYDYILIDSRTGISDYSGICNIQLPEVNVMVIAATMQNFEGCKTIIKKIEDAEYLKITGRKAQILPILSRLDRSSEQYTKWEQKFAEYFSPLIQHLDKNLAPEFLPEVFKDVYYNDTFLPYTTAISAGENIFANDKSITKSHYAWPFLNIAELIEDLNIKKGTEFYKKIDETSWYRYADQADRSKNKKKAAIAYNQIGIKQKETSDQIVFFERASKLDPENKEIQQNLINAFANQQNYETNTPYISEITETLVANEKLQRDVDKGPNYKESKPAGKWAIYVLTGILITVGVGLYMAGAKRTAAGAKGTIDSLKDSIKNALKNDTSAFIDPASKGSIYFDSIRNQKKPMGIDISSRNQVYDFSKTKSYGISFMLIKATEGKTYQDPSFKINWLAVKKSNIVRGAYHYYTLNNFAKPDLQAENYIQSVKLLDGDLPPILNLYAYEGSYKGAADPSIKANLRTYLDRISIYYGAKPIVFITGPFAKYFLSGNDLSNCYLWKNQSNQDLYQPDQTPGWKNWTFWQFSTRETFEGILTTPDKNNEKFVDANQFNGSNQDLLNLTLKASPGRNAVMAADRFFTEPNLLFQTTNTDKLHVKYNNITFAADSFKRIKFNWDVELINRSFASLNSPALYGKGYDALFNLLKAKNYSVNNKNDIHIGDIAFYDFQEKKGVQACGLIYNFDDTYVYAIEAYDAKSQLKVRTTKRFIADVFAFARISQ